MAEISGIYRESLSVASVTLRCALLHTHRHGAGDCVGVPMKIEITLPVADACAALAFIDKLAPDRVGEIPAGLVVIADAVDAAVRELDAPAGETCATRGGE